MESVPRVNVPLGALRVLDLFNESDMDHPFHLHGFFFQVLSTNGVATPPSALANKEHHHREAQAGAAPGGSLR